MGLSGFNKLIDQRIRREYSHTVIAGSARAVFGDCHHGRKVYMLKRRACALGL